jgi:hypothetical protein
MGAILRVDCVDGGYEAELNVGVGMQGIEYEAFECETCRDLVAVAITPRRPDEPAAPTARCPGCGGEELMPARWSGDEGERLVECPRCRGWATVMPAGIWD